MKLFVQETNDKTAAMVVVRTPSENRRIMSETKYIRNRARSLSYTAYWIQVPALESASQV